jgi:NADH oxidase (H2O2-forming)
MKRVVIIGGSSAGATCAFEIRKLDKDVEIIILEKNGYTQYSPCAMPYVLSGEIVDFDKIFIFKKKDYEQNNISLNLNSEVIDIDEKRKCVVYKCNNERKQIVYDKLIIATGSYCSIPKIKGIEKSTYFVLKSLDDAKEIASNIKSKSSSVIIGAGLIGVELAISLSAKGEKVTLIEAKDNILFSMLDSDMALKLKEKIENKNLEIIESANIEEISQNKIILNDSQIKFEKLFVCTGVKPNLNLPKTTNINIDRGIVVNEYMQTSNKDIYACGDCTESVEFNSNEKIISALGTTATRQAKIIAQNIVGCKNKFAPVLNNTITKIGNVFVGSVGLTKSRCDELKIKTVSATYTQNVRAEYYSSKSKITIKIICDMKGLILGSQIIGEEDVVGRVNLMALALQKKCKIEELIKLETCYNPASAPIFDPITIVSEICFKKLKFMNKNNN